MTIISLSLGSATNNALELSMVLLPKVIDSDIIKIELAFNGFAGWMYSVFQQPISPLWQTLVNVSYEMLSISLLLMLSLIYRERKTVVLNSLRVLIVPFFLAFSLYCFNPVIGPLYAFGSDYPHNLEAILAYPKGGFIFAPSLRNGMPSMHFTGAMLIVLATCCLTRKIYFYVSCVFAVLTFIATMALGEHYLLDLIVAAPFCIALGTGLLNPPEWGFHKRRIWWICALLFVAWEVMLHADTLRFFLVDNLWFVRLFSAASVLSAVWGFATFVRTVWHLPAPTESEWLESLNVKEKSEVEDKAPMRWVLGLFVCSGFAGLLYEVIFAKHLGVIFGGTALAAYTVMATYMGGMALGAWLGGIIADRVRSPLKYYALFEAAIGLYALATPSLFKITEYLYVGLATDIRPDAPVLTLWRVLLGVIVLGIPTILMGTTLPLMFKFLRGYLPGRGNIIARLYTANIFGAGFGALLGAYVILPILGLLSATRLAALLSLMIALYAIDKLKTLKIPDTVISLNGIETNLKETEVKGYMTLRAQEPRQKRRLGIASLLVVSVGGVVTLALEVVNMHMLSIVAGNSVYAFGLMLATFLIGLGLGSIAYNKLRYLLTDPAIVSLAQLGIFFSIMISAFQWEGLTEYLASFGPMQEYQHLDFLARELIRGGVCAIIMMPAAIFIGLGYPATMALASNWLKHRGEGTGLGIASLYNTLGNIIGVLLAGFVFLNWWGSNRLLLSLAGLSLILAVYMICVSRNAWIQAFKNDVRILRITTIATMVSAIFALWVYPAQWNFSRIATGANVYFAPTNHGEAIDARESIQGGLTTVHQDTIKEENKEETTLLTLLTNGKFQGNNQGEVEAQKAFAQVPLLHQPKRDNVLVIGYGTGNSAHTLREYGFKQMDIAEISPDIVTLADQYFGNINGLISQGSNVAMYYTDGRNYLLTQNKHYDLISMEITSIWFSGAANLYNREFYQLVKTRLKTDGVLQQWVQIHHMRPIDLIYLLNTVHQDFRYVWLYVVGGQGILIASNSEQSNQNYHLDGRIADSQDDMTQEEKSLQERRLLTPLDLDYLAKKLRVPQFLVSTDNNLYLEYATPKGNAVSYDVFARNIEMLEKLSKEREEREGRDATQSVRDKKKLVEDKLATRR
ncbi:MAG: phosphatase PAP2 family protein [Cardiobacteriaceae bacterium]|nr:phosphatase PAP2 family protein [Cardiobacteriaceae bacterium]